MGEGNLFVERRAHPRVPLVLPVKYRKVEEQGELQTLRDRRKNSESFTKDISLGGMYITPRDPVAKGDILRLELTLEKERTISAFVEVVWCSENGCGLHFLAIRDEDLQMLKQLMESQG